MFFKVCNVLKLTFHSFCHSIKLFNKVFLLKYKISFLITNISSLLNWYYSINISGILSLLARGFHDCISYEFLFCIYALVKKDAILPTTWHFFSLLHFHFTTTLLFIEFPSTNQYMSEIHFFLVKSILVCNKLYRC